MEILSSRTLLRPNNLERTQAFYRDILGLAIFRVFGLPESGHGVFLWQWPAEVASQLKHSVRTTAFAVDAGSRC